MNQFDVPLTDEVEVSTEPKAIRAWARLNGHEVGDRGRISSEVRNSYLEAHGLLDTNQD